MYFEESPNKKDVLKPGLEESYCDEFRLEMCARSEGNPHNYVLPEPDFGSTTSKNTSSYHIRKGFVVAYSNKTSSYHSKKGSVVPYLNKASLYHIKENSVNKGLTTILGSEEITYHETDIDTFARSEKSPSKEATLRNNIACEETGFEAYVSSKGNQNDEAPLESYVNPGTSK